MRIHWGCYPAVQGRRHGCLGIDGWSWSAAEIAYVLGIDVLDTESFATLVAGLSIRFCREREQGRFIAPFKVTSPQLGQPTRLGRVILVNRSARVEIWRNMVPAIQVAAFAGDRKKVADVTGRN